MITPFDLSELEFRLIRDLIHQQFGLLFKDEKISFVKMKLYPRITQLGLHSFNDYFNLVKYSSHRERELSMMISLLTNNETYFFRESPQLKVFAERLLPELRAQKAADGNQEIKILSAGCSTGEEVYTLAMLAYETGSFFWNWDLQILGIDINEPALEVARRGIYYPRSLRMTDPAYIQKFFSANSGDYQAKDVIKKMTAFSLGNIVEASTWEKISRLDIIFCRNVMIYFSEEMIKQTVRFLHQALRKGGYLLLGHAETLLGICEDFEPIRAPETILYRKR
jgi:chemotaxis protein methyltransferase CheR